MKNITRRELLTSVAAYPTAAWASARRAGVSGKPTDIRIEEVRFEYEEFLYRFPYMFGGRRVDRVTLLNVHCVVRTRAGKSASGFGSMTMGNMWSFPSRKLSYSATLDAMKALASRIGAITSDYKEYGHPVDLSTTLEPLYYKAADQVSRDLKLVESIPKLCTLVTASPFDAALHDAFGKVHARNCYYTYGSDFMSRDLAHYLGPDFRGEFADRYILKKPVPRLPIYHSVGALDPIFESDIKERVNDGLPETLPEWIQYNGITHVKIKLNGEDREGDIARILKIDRAVEETEKKRGISDWKYLLDFNENCPNVAYVLEVLAKVKEKAPGGFLKIQYVEQPTARDLKANRANTMHEAARLRPIVIDESLVDLESLLMAREMGYTGVALKACKGQNHALLMAAAAQKYKMFLCVQDLTCPGASLIHSAGLAAHVPGVAAIEANARQYVPAANKPWEGKFPGIFRIKDGTINTSVLTGPGLGAV